MEKIPPKTSTLQPNFTEPELSPSNPESRVQCAENPANIELQKDSMSEAAPHPAKSLPTRSIRLVGQGLLHLGRNVSSLFYRGVDSVSHISVMEKLHVALNAASESIPNLAEQGIFSAQDLQNPFSAGTVKEESLDRTQDGKTRYSKKLEISGFNALEKIGSHHSKILTLNVHGEDLQFTQQMVIDFSRGQKGTQDLFIGKPGVERENTGSHVTQTDNWRENPQWLEDSLRKIHTLTGKDADTTLRVTTFTNQRILNNIIFNLQNDVSEKLKILVTQGNYKMSWRLYTEPSADGQSEDIVVRAEIYGKVPNIVKDSNVCPADGEFSGVAVINLTTNIADVLYDTCLDLKNNEDDSAQ